VADRIRLYFDEDSQGIRLVRALRARQIDVVTCNEVGLGEQDDESQLTYSTAENRVIFTFNRSDFARLHKQWLVSGRSHAGIIVSGQLRIGLLLQRILKLIDERSAEDMRDRIEYLGNWR
jgi:hypothetical protein